jgi:hypothetical protein
VGPRFECATSKSDVIMNHELHEFCVTLLCTTSQSLFPSYTHRAFTVELAQTIHLGTKDRWEVGICEFACPPPKVGMYKPLDLIGLSTALVYCNLFSTQFLGNEIVRSLRTFTFPSQLCQLTYDNIYYMPVEKKYTPYTNRGVNTSGQTRSFHP